MWSKKCHYFRLYFFMYIFIRISSGGSVDKVYKKVAFNWIHNLVMRKENFEISINPGHVSAAKTNLLFSRVYSSVPHKLRSILFLFVSTKFCLVYMAMPALCSSNVW